MTLLGVWMALSGASQQSPDSTAAAPSAPAAQTPGALSPGNANYRITARLDPDARTITGDETLTWRNTATRPAATLQFHLYYNAWRDGQSTWMRERARAGRASAVRQRPEDSASIDIRSLRVIRNGVAADLTARTTFIAPDDGNVHDRTVIEVPLDSPVAPGDSLDVQVGWQSRIPRTVARTGAVGDFFFIAQWFPKIGVFEDAGWNCHQFHASTEFFADFGTYDVELTVPTGWTVGATGRERARTDRGDGTTTHRYVQAAVHDFAWTTSPDYIERRDRFEHATLPPVDMRLLLQPEHAGQADRHFAATRAALKYYGEWYGAYPYGHITIVDPAWQSGAGGMEYPTLFTAGTEVLSPARTGDPEEVTVHEAGHQFWYGIVATNEFEHAWMDEGLTTFSTARVMDEAYEPNFYSERYFGGFVPWVFRDLPLDREADGNRMAGYRRAAKGDAPSTPSFRYWPGSGGAITYNKTSLWLHTLERMLGWETLQRAMSTYFTRHALTHPRPRDFFDTVNEISGRDLTWFFEQVHGGSHVFDYSLDLLRSEQGTSGYHTAVVARRLGEGVFPIDVQIVFEDGSAQRWNWDGRERWKLFETDRPVRALHAQVDPERILLLDVNTTNNSASLKPRAKAAARTWSLAWLLWLQDHLLTYGFFV
ncbi:MAG TPA: M1 family metallopeptidase [Vicinamibacterales bacterium]|nr:M1 family metallopeptidase [Vicinamibacterales bacterium]